MKRIYYTLSRARRDQSGATLIEFAVVFPVFILIVFSILEFSMIMFASSAVNNAVVEAGRAGMTGSTYDSIEQGPGARQHYIEQKVADYLGSFANMGTMTISNSTYDQISNVGMDGKEVQNAAAYGSGSQIVKYRIEFDWKVMSPLMSPFLGGVYPITATVLVKNESFK